MTCWLGADQPALSKPSQRDLRRRDDAARACAAGAGRRASAPATTTTTDVSDLFVTYYGHNVLYQQLGGGRFEDVTDARWTRAARRALGIGLHVRRLDRDGRLDLFVANYLRFDLATAQRTGREGRTAPGKAFPSIAVPKGCRPTPTSSIATRRWPFEDVSDALGDCVASRDVIR